MGGSASPAQSLQIEKDIRLGLTGRRREHFVDNQIYVGVGGAVVHDAGAQSELSADGGIRDIHAPAADHLAQDRGVPLFEILQIPLAITETDRAEFDGREQLKRGVPLNSAGQPLRLLQVGPDGLPDGIDSVIAQREPQLQRPKAPRELE